MPEYLQSHDRHNIAYHRHHGNNTPGVIFLSGFMSDMSGEKAQAVMQWCQTFDHSCVRFDYFGHGESSGDFEQGTISRWLEDAITVIDELSNGPQVLVGSSMGGWLSLLAALQRPQRIAGLIGIAAAPDFTKNLVENRLDENAKTQLHQNGVCYRPSQYSDQPYAITRALIDDGYQHLLLHDDIALSCPVRLLHGQQDIDVPWQISMQICAKLASSDVTVTILKDAEHRLSRLSDLTLLTATLAQLCQGY